MFSGEKVKSNLRPIKKFDKNFLLKPFKKYISWMWRKQLKLIFEFFQIDGLNLHIDADYTDSDLY